MKVEESPAYHDTFEVVTPSYRAPELVYGTEFSCPIDMWAAAVMRHICHIIAYATYAT